MMDFCGVFNLDAEKIENKGEDATTFKFDENGNGYMFVFDGSGGAGSEKHLDLDGEKSAYIASRACALYCTDYFKSKKDEAINVSEFAEQIYAYFIENGAHDPIVSFKGNVEDIRGCLDYIYQNISTVISDYVAEVEATDHNSLQT